MAKRFEVEGLRQHLFSVTMDDCEVQTFKAGGKGGQSQNKTNSGVRIIHRASGARGEARDSRDQLTNKRAAFRRMVDSSGFQKWLRLRCAELATGKSVDQIVDEMMTDENILTEVRGPRGWEENNAEEV